MSFLQLLGLAGTMGTILGGFLALYGLINNRTLKQEARDTREILVRIEQGQQRLAEGQLRVEEMQAQARTEMAEAIRYLADLIRVESGRRG